MRNSKDSPYIRQILFFGTRWRQEAVNQIIKKQSNVTQLKPHTNRKVEKAKSEKLKPISYDKC
jgi:hypothetical protein